VAAPLASPAELEAHLQASIPDSQATLVLAGASGAVRAYCGWNLTRETRTFYLMGDGSPLLTLPTLELVSVEEVRVGDVTLDLVASAPVVLRHGQILLPEGWIAGAVIQVDATHGYDAVSVPDVLRLVTLTIAARTVNNPDNYKTANVGTVTRAYDPGLTALDARLLAPYRLE
jgi:hypothetical protein